MKVFKPNKLSIRIHFVEMINRVSFFIIQICILHPLFLWFEVENECIDNYIFFMMDKLFCEQRFCCSKVASYFNLFYQI